MGVAGSVILLGKSAEEAEEAFKEQRQTKATVPCVGASDLGGLELALLLPHHQSLTIQMHDAQSASVSLPRGVDPTSVGERPIVVSRFPRATRDFLKQGDVLGNVRP
jgi:hypothetical protein